MDISRITEDAEVCKSSIERGNFQVEPFRIARFARLIAGLVINASGEVNIKKMTEVMEKFQITSYGAFDAVFPLHVKQILSLFLQKKNQLKIKQLSFPLANNWVHEIIKKTIGQEREVEKRDISTAIITALLTFLRQTVGSCFATAPIILMQTNEPQFIFDDLYDLITRGQLKRVIDGVEYKVPISIKTSLNLEFESPLLRTYEYTVASFADWKTEFYKRNMYTALGLNTKDIGGMGEAILSLLEAKLEKVNGELQRLHEEIYLAEDRYKKSGAKAETYQIAILGNEYNQKKEEGEKIAGFYPFFVDELLKLFPLYFQEVFDPEMSHGSAEILEDRPAGFRLLFKHGRSDPTMWTMISTEKEYIQALEDFFKSIEKDFVYVAAFPSAEKLIREIIDRVIEVLNEPLFNQKAHLRIGHMRENESSGVEVIKPWAYISGGNLESLVTIYYSLKNPLIKKAFFPESPLQLAAYLIDYMKDLSYEISKQFENNPLKGILMTNEAHSFLFKPGLKIFEDAWHDSGNTYTYIRDHNGPIPFADTNWGSELFAFDKDPKTGDLKLYRKGTFDLRPLPASWDSFFSKTSAWTLWLMS